MKKFGHMIIVMILASVVFYTGTGVTIMNYCCSNCEDSHDIFAGHDHKHHQMPVENEQNTNSSSCPHCLKIESDFCDLSYNESDMNCTASRISLDIDSYQYRAQLSVPFVWLQDISEISLQLTQDMSKSVNLFSDKESPPGIIPRTYLSRISVLII